jgi:hypothetical protein
MSASVSPTKHGTKKKPKKTKLIVKLTEGRRLTVPACRDANGWVQRSFAATKTVVHLGSELQFNGTAFPTCTNAQVTSDDSKCPAKSKVGFGKATGNALNIDEHLNVTAYNGPAVTSSSCCSSAPTDRCRSTRRSRACSPATRQVRQEADGQYSAEPRVAGVGRVRDAAPVRHDINAVTAEQQARTSASSVQGQEGLVRRRLHVQRRDEEERHRDHEVHLI